MTTTRRNALLMLLACAVTTRPRPVYATLFADNAELERGRFVWQPDRQSQGPVFIAVDALSGSVHVWRGGVEIGMARGTPQGAASTGMTEGLFHLAPRPGTTGLHAWTASPIHKAVPAPRRNGPQPAWGEPARGEPARGETGLGGILILPQEFTQRLAAITPQGASCLMTQSRSQGEIVETDADLLLLPSEAIALMIAGSLGAPGSLLRSQRAPMSLLVFLDTGRADLIDDGRLAGHGDVVLRGEEPPVGTWTYQLLGASGGRLKWLAIGTGGAVGLAREEAINALARLAFTDSAGGLQLLMRLRPGSMVVVSETRGDRASETRGDRASETRGESMSEAGEDRVTETGSIPSENVTLFADRPPGKTMAAVKPRIPRRPAERHVERQVQAVRRVTRRVPAVEAVSDTNATVRSIFQPY